MINTKFKLKYYFILITYAILLYLAASNIGLIGTFLGKVLTILSPFIVGFFFAYILNILVNFLEKKLFYRLEKLKKPFIRKFERLFSILTAFLLVFAFMTAVIMFVVPQLSRSISTLISNIPGYMDKLQAFITDMSVRFNLSSEFVRNITVNWNEIITKTGQFISKAFPQILTFTFGLTSGIINIVMGLIVAIYLLFTKEKMIIILKKLIYAFIPEKTAEKIINTGSQANDTFQKFIAGQITEALIIGFLVFIGMLIFRFPYALLCAVIISITSLIPVVGAWIGAIPSAFIILMSEPSKVIWFILFIVALQQIEGNLIYPKVVGDSIGLGGLWVLFAIIVGGSLFGVIGMLLGVPVFAVLYSIIKKITNRRLSEKNIEVE